MTDIEIAKELLENEKLSLVVVKDGIVVFSSGCRGIEPLYKAVTEFKSDLMGSSVADKVTGKAAARLCVYAGIENLSTKIISENAVPVLRDAYISYSYEESSPYIKNRDDTGICPVEALSLKSDRIEDLLYGISSFLEHIKRLEKNEL